MVKTLGALDILSAFLLLSIGAKVEIPIAALIIIPLLLFLKACICIFDIGAIIDIGVLILIILSIFLPLPFWILLIGVILIGLKGVMSFIA